MQSWIDCAVPIDIPGIGTYPGVFDTYVRAPSSKGNQKFKHIHYYYIDPMTEEEILTDTDAKTLGEALMKMCYETSFGCSGMPSRLMLRHCEAICTRWKDEMLRVISMLCAHSSHREKDLHIIRLVDLDTTIGPEDKFALARDIQTRMRAGELTFDELITGFSSIPRIFKDLDVQVN
jgi:hypothetical protein